MYLVPHRTQHVSVTYPHPPRHPCWPRVGDGITVSASPNRTPPRPRMLRLKRGDGATVRRCCPDPHPTLLCGDDVTRHMKIYVRSIPQKQPETRSQRVTSPHHHKISPSKITPTPILYDTCVTFVEFYMTSLSYLGDFKL